MQLHQCGPKFKTSELSMKDKDLTKTKSSWPRDMVPSWSLECEVYVMRWTIDNLEDQWASWNQVHPHLVKPLIIIQCIQSRCYINGISSTKPYHWCPHLMPFDVRSHICEACKIGTKWQTIMAIPHDTQWIREFPYCHWRPHRATTKSRGKIIAIF